MPSSERWQKIVENGGTWDATAPALNANMNTITHKSASRAGAPQVSYANFYTDEHVADSLSTSLTEVFDTLVKLKAGKAPGKDSITPELLSKCASGIANSLSLQFNRSFSECRIPSDWKEALVVAIHKGGSRTIPTNYRPVTLLSVVSKVLEKIVHRRLSMLLQPVLSCKQSGFRKQDSTEFQLTRLVQHSGA